MVGWIPELREVAPRKYVKKYSACVQCGADISMIRANKFCSFICRALYNEEKYKAQHGGKVQQSIGVRQFALDIEKMYRDGVILEDIGKKFGVTRERIRQILILIGVTPEEGGARVRAEKRRSDLIERKNDSYMRKYGITVEEYQALAAMRDSKGRSYRLLFSRQKSSALTRGIEWKMTYPQWIKFWIASGKLTERGKSQEGYCMARVNDTGAYELGNVYISTISATSTKGVEEGRNGDKETELRAIIRNMGGVSAIAKFLGVSIGYLHSRCTLGSLSESRMKSGMAEKLASHEKSPFTAAQWKEKFTYQRRGKL